MSTPTEFEASWNEGEDAPVGATAAALTAKRKADDTEALGIFSQSFKNQTAIPADAAGIDVQNTAVDKVGDDADEGVATEVTKSAA